jgi:hypothetical protein
MKTNVKISQDSSVSILAAYGLDNQVLITCSVKNLSLCHHIQTSSAVHPIFYTMDNRGSFPGDKATKA